MSGPGRLRRRTCLVHNGPALRAVLRASGAVFRTFGAAAVGGRTTGWDAVEGAVSDAGSKGTLRSSALTPSV